MSNTNSSRARQQRIQQLLDQAAELPAAERDIFLSAECGDDQTLRQEIYAHLLAESRGMAKKKLASRPGPVTSAVNQALMGSEHDRRVELLGKVVGDYRLVAIVGVGGAGTVYLGERADRAYSAQVAIKVVANTQLSNEVQRRFAAERQILANLNHPYIGRLLDAGETFFDEPFLVMEYVHGETIDRYCDNQRLTVVERIQLFLKVCEAVQYAHRNLIVHRDLKPGNILISKEGIPKLLDFGIAKLLDDSAMAVLQDGIVAHTRVHDRLLTPEYASPEQIRGQPVTTTSDVYALGVILYELLTGTRPYSVNAQNQLELERSICIQDAIKPSQQVAELAKPSSTASATSSANAETPSSTRAESKTLIATARNTTFKKLDHQLQGDLDAIILRALRKEPDKRYSSVEHLMDDLNRHLNQEPVEARQGNRWYYTQRFIRRHTLGVIAGTTAILSLIAVAIILSLQAKRLTEQRDIAKQQRDKATQESSRAESVSNFMLEVFTAADPFQSQDKQVTAKELLDNAAKKIESTLDDQPEVKARLLEAIGEAYTNQERLDSAIYYLKLSLQIQRGVRNTDVYKLSKNLATLGHAYMILGDLALAEKNITEARSLLERAGATKSEAYLQTLTESNLLSIKMNNMDSSDRYFKKSSELTQELYGESSIKYGGILMMSAQSKIYSRTQNEGLSQIREVVKIYHAALPERHPDRLQADFILSQFLFLQGQLTEAEDILIKRISDFQIVFGKNSPRLIAPFNTLSQIQIQEHKWSLAESSAKTGLVIANESSSKSNLYAGQLHATTASIFIKTSRFSAGKKEAQLSLDIFLKILPPDHLLIASSEYLLAKALVGQQQDQKALKKLRENIPRLLRAEAPMWRVARSESLLGFVLLKLHKPAEAEKLLTHADQILSARNSGALPDEIAVAHKRVEQYQQCVKENRLNNCTVDL